MNDREPQQESAQSVSVCVRTSRHTGVRMCVCKETERKKRERASHISSAAYSPAQASAPAQPAHLRSLLLHYNYA